MTDQTEAPAPVAWLVEGDVLDQRVRYSTEDGDAAARMAQFPRITVTRMVPAPPEGAPSYGDLLEAIREYLAADEAVDREAERTASNPAGWSSAHVIRRAHVVDTFRALLSRIPKDAAAGGAS